jgi:hypothetical protein
MNKELESAIEYEPFGKDWEDEMMSISKKDLVFLLKRACIKNSNIELINKPSLEIEQ